MNKTKSITKIISIIMAVLIASSAMSLTVSSAPSPEAPAKISVERSTSAIKLSWSKVSGAKGYRIYYKLPVDLTWRAVVKSTTATSHTLKKLPEGQSYLFAVRSYTKSGDKTVWGGYAQIATATKTAAPKKVTATQSGSSVKLSWSEVESATGYRIYYKTSAKASWKTLVGSTKKTKYTVKELKAGTNYMFAVRSYVKSSLGTFLGKYKTVDLTVKPTTPSMDVAITGNKSVKLSWSKVDADGYRVYYKVGNSSWKTAVSKTTKTSYSFNNLTYGKNYTFAVKAYVKTGSKVIWSGYNTVGYYCREMITTTARPTTTTLPTTTRPPTTAVTETTTRLPTTKPTTTVPATTKPMEPEGVDVTINDIYSNENVLYVAIDSRDWGSKIKSNSGRVDIYVDGVKADKQAIIQISSSTNGDGCQCIFVDISMYEVEDYGGKISFTVPEGFLVNFTGTKYNYAFEVSVCF